MLFKTIFYFYKFYGIEYIIYFAFNNNIIHIYIEYINYVFHIYIYIYEKRNLVKKLNYIIIILFYINRENVIKMIFLIYIIIS